VVVLASDIEFSFLRRLSIEIYGEGKRSGCGCGYRIYWFEFAEAEWLPQVSKSLAINLCKDGGDDGGTDLIDGQIKAREIDSRQL